MIGNVDYSTLKAAEGKNCCHYTRQAESESQAMLHHHNDAGHHGWQDQGGLIQ
jgi:hypothetical protein